MNKIKSAFEEITADEALKEKTLNAVLEKANKKVRFPVKHIIAAACAAVILATSGMTAWAYCFKPVDYVSVDGSVNVELGINRLDRVVSVESYNEPVEADLKMKKCDEAIRLLALSAEDNVEVNSSETVAEAKKLGLTCGQFRAYCQAADAGLTLDADEIKNLSPNEIRALAGIETECAQNGEKHSAENTQGQKHHNASNAGRHGQYRHHKK